MRPRLLTETTVFLVTQDNYLSLYMFILLGMLNGLCIVEVSTLQLWPIEAGDLARCPAIETSTRSARLVSAS